MIPKTIHYCWFGNSELPKEALKCIHSWERILPDYKIKRWDESNFDVNICPYVSKAYSERKFAFVSDYARFYALYREGGIYLDVDVEVIKSINSFLSNKMFAGFETNKGVNPGLILGSIKGTELFKEVLSSYHTMNFEYAPQKMKTVVSVFTPILVDKGLKLDGSLQNIDDITVYPCDYFSPINFFTGKRTFTENTHTIHHYAATWGSFKTKYKTRLLKYSLPRIIYNIIKNRK